jgi:hypothetical protein
VDWLRVLRCVYRSFVLFGCESELVGLVDLLFSVESSSLQVVDKGVLVVSTLTTPVISLCRLLLFFPSRDDSLLSRGLGWEVCYLFVVESFDNGRYYIRLFVLNVGYTLNS